MGLQQTAHCFQTEWSAIIIIGSVINSYRYELSITGQLSDQYQHNVPDVYAQYVSLLIVTFNISYQKSNSSTKS